MVDIALTGPLNRGLNDMADLISNSATFQALTGTANAAAALAFIKFYNVPEDDITFPLAFIDFDEYSSSSLAVGTGQTFRGRAKMMVAIGLPIPAAQINADGTVDVRNAKVYMTNKVGAIISEIRALAGTSGQNGAYINEVTANDPMMTAEHSTDDISGSIATFWELG